MRTIFIFLLGLFFTGTSWSAHVLGGMVAAEVIEVDMANATSQVEIKFSLYRDELGSGSGFDGSEAQFGVYRKIGSGDYVVQEVVIGVMPDIMSPVSFSSSVEIARGDYTFTIILDQGYDYLFAYQRCCRASTFSNLFEPEETGIVIQMELMEEALLSTGASPQLSGVPFTLAELGESFQERLPLAFDSMLTVTIDFTAPIESGGIFDATGPNAGFVGCCECVRPDPANCLPPFGEVVFLPPYDAADPFANMVNLDATALELRGFMNVNGVFQYGIEILSERNGILLSRQIFDYALFALLTDDIGENLSHESLLYPNPSQGGLMLDKFPFVPDTYEIQGMDGKTIQAGRVEGDRLLLPKFSGMYIVTLSNSRSGEYLTERVFRL